MKDQISEIVVSIGPACAVIIEEAANFGRHGINRDVVETEVAMDENAVIGLGGHPFVDPKDAIEPGYELWIIDHAWERCPTPVTGLGPGNPRRQPARHIGARYARVLLHQYEANRPADAPGQRRIGPGPLIQAPRINESAYDRPHVVTRRGFEKNAGDGKAAPIRQQAKDSPLNR